MALVRCEQHGKPDGVVRNYVMVVQPIGYPGTAATCGRQDCLDPGMVWLDAEEARAYKTGQRVFAVSNAGIKVQVL